MKDNDLLMIVLAFFLGFCFRKMMRGQLVEGSETFDLTGDSYRVEFNNCIATQNKQIFGNVNNAIDNECFEKTYEECISLMNGGTKYLNGMAYGCTPSADRYVRQNSDGTCPNGYENTSDTGFTRKIGGDPLPLGCVNSCGHFCWPWEDECNGKYSDITEHAEHDIKLCKKENVYGIN